jgi:GH15 family glucan-1,4-alpha-glucosidase
MLIVKAEKKTSLPNASTGAFQADDTIGHSAFPPIGDYAFLSDCEANCLIAPSGSVEWMCLPRPDSPSLFGAMLDRSAGNFRLGPYDETVPAARRYVPGSLMLETTWQTRTGWVIVRDTLCIGPWHNVAERSRTHRRSPTDHDAEHCLLRTVRCVNGSVEMSMTCEPRFDYGRVEAQWGYEGEGYGQLVAKGQDIELRVATDLRPGIERYRISARTRMVEGDQHFVAMSWGSLPPPLTYDEAVERMARTSEHWRQWITDGDFPDHRWRHYLQRSALTLKGLTYAPTGALLAAATTSLPEAPGGERNWDYRYAWVRDSTFALWGLYTLGFDREADDFFSFIGEVCRDGEALQIMYGIGGERRLTESVLEHLSGYEGAAPVRVGNAAFAQEQHDVWGAVLDSVLLHARSRSSLQEWMWPLLQKQVNEAAAHWMEPDRGIWEVRGEPQHFTSSKFMCWVALDRGARLARMFEKLDAAKEWQEIADTIRADICANGVDERGVFVQRYGSTGLDASLLLMPLLRFLPPDDPRIRATVLAIADELTSGGLVLRYRSDETDDGLRGREGSFTICSFWLVSALVEIGEVDRGRRLCERLLSLASPLELYAEEIDPHSGRHLGNFPQAFTHLALINAVMHVVRAEEAQSRGATNIHGNPVDVNGDLSGHPEADEPVFPS